MRSCQPPTIGSFFFLASAKIYDRVFFLICRLPLFKSHWGSRLRMRGRSRFFNLKQVTHQAEDRVKNTSPRSIALTLAIFFLSSGGSHKPHLLLISTHLHLATQDLLVWLAGVKRTEWSNEITLDKGPSLLLITVQKGFHYQVLGWLECKKGILKTRQSSFFVSNDRTEVVGRALLFP